MLSNESSESIRAERFKAVMDRRCLSLSGPGTAKVKREGCIQAHAECADVPVRQAPVSDDDATG